MTSRLGSGNDNLFLQCTLNSYAAGILTETWPLVWPRFLIECLLYIGPNCKKLFVLSPERRLSRIRKSLLMMSRERNVDLFIITEFLILSDYYLPRG